MATYRGKEPWGHTKLIKIFVLEFDISGASEGKKLKRNIFQVLTLSRSRRHICRSLVTPKATYMSFIWWRPKRHICRLEVPDLFLAPFSHIKSNYKTKYRLYAKRFYDVHDVGQNKRKWRHTAGNGVKQRCIQDGITFIFAPKRHFRNVVNNVRKIWPERERVKNIYECRY